MVYYNHMSYSALSKRCNPKGFTLIELLVVISIIAILSVVGIVIFTGAQKNARDARRRVDINAIANAMEVNYSLGKYIPLSDTMFSSGKIPQDPLAGLPPDYRGPNACNGRECFYCSNTNISEPSRLGCDGGDERIWQTDRTIINGGSRYYICANLESTVNPTYYCRSNQR